MGRGYRTCRYQVTGEHLRGESGAALGVVVDEDTGLSAASISARPTARPPNGTTCVPLNGQRVPLGGTSGTYRGTDPVKTSRNMPLTRGFRWWAILGSKMFYPLHGQPVSPTIPPQIARHWTPRRAASIVCSGTERATN